MATSEPTPEEQALRRLKELEAQARVQAAVAAARADAFATAVDILSRSPF